MSNMEQDLTNPQKYSEFVASICKPGDDIIAELSPGKAELLHMAVGVSGEAGELLDAIKKHVIYGKTLDAENVIEELGDIEFFLQGIRNLIKVSRDYVVSENITKLSARYPSGYSNKAAIRRADKELEKE